MLEPPNSGIARGLVLVAKILQNLSTNMKFGESFMKDLDEFIQDSYPSMKKFLLSLAVTIPVRHSFQQLICPRKIRWSPRSPKYSGMIPLKSSTSLF
jgi:hypothetical protein